MRRLLFVFILLMAASGLRASDPLLYVYRGDSLLHHRIPLVEGTLMEHSGGDLHIGDLSVPFHAVDSAVVRHTDIPTLRITLPDYPDSTELWVKKEYIAARLTVDGNGMVPDTTDMELNIRGRGNSTWGLAKKPMRLKFDKKTSICGFKKAKSYALLADYLDPTHARNAVALWLAQRLGMSYANHFMPVNVVLNGCWKGMYLLTEKIGTNSGSVDIDETSGMLFELSSQFDQKYQFRSRIYNLPVMVKDPDFDELERKYPDGPMAAERMALWEDDFNRAESIAVELKGFEVFDRDAFVDYMLVYNLAGNNEIGFPKSQYIYKENMEPDSKYCYGPVWDFDVAFGIFTSHADTLVFTDPREPLWINPLMDDLVMTDGFQEAYEARFEQFHDEIFPELLEFLDGYAALVDPSLKLDGVTWPEYDDRGWIIREISFDTDVNFRLLRYWLTERVAYMKAQIE
ncbi:MAG: CotH kinase family protein, partial [Muribaculaceae bacterium]|nr:CotH kinase family protein [Muribaculaceae bacterium]